MQKIKVLFFTWLSVTVLILVAACNKKDGGQPPPPAAAAPAPVKKDQEKKDGVSQSADKSEKSADSGSDSGALSKINGVEILMDPVGYSADEIFASSERVGEVQPGLEASVKSDPVLFYSGSSFDMLREQISDIVNTENDPEQTRRNREFAAKIGLVTFEVDWAKRATKISLIVREHSGKSIEIPDSFGKLDSKLHVKGAFNKDVKYEAVCMDYRGLGCWTTHVKLTLRTDRGPAYAHVLARKTPGYIYADESVHNSKSKNSEFDFFFGLFRKSEQRPGASGTVKKLTFYTSEVINGVSEFAIFMRLGVSDPLGKQASGQLIGWRGPLVKPLSGSKLNLPVSTPVEVTGGEHTSENGPARVANMIRETRLIRNDGRGNLQFDVTIRKTSEETAEDTLRLTVARRHRPVRELILR